MSFWDNLFSKPESTYEGLTNRLSTHEQNSTAKLHTTHPHVKGIFAKYNIDLKQVRKHGSKIAAAAAVLGVFLAIPQLFGHPTNTSQVPQPTKAGEISKLVPPATQALEAATSQPAASQGPTSPNQPSTPPTGSSGVPLTQTPPVQPPKQDDQSKSQGHTYGRSYMAPPKEHGYHDLGLHKGATKNPQVPDVGSHPSELDVNKKNQEEQT